jgi:hypothetical protein
MKKSQNVVVLGVCAAAVMISTRPSRSAHARGGAFTSNRKRRSRLVLFRNPTWTIVEWGL